MKYKAKDNPIFRFSITWEAVALVATILVCVFLNFSLADKNRYDSEYLDKSSYYHDSRFDLRVSGASLEQIADFKANPNVTRVSKTAIISLNMKTKTAEDHGNVVVFDNAEDREFSEFSSKRIVEITNDSANSVGVDYQFSRLHQVKLGDSISVTLNGHEKYVKVSKIYRTDYLYPEGIVVATKDVLDISGKSYFAYLNIKNMSLAKKELRTYKPQGTLLEKTTTQTDEDYQKYLDEFNAKEYYSTCVVDIRENEKKTIADCLVKKEKANKMCWISVIISSAICFAVSMVCFFFNAKNKKDKIYKYIQQNGNKRIFAVFSLFNLSFIGMIVAGTLITFVLSLDSLATFYSFSAVLANAYYSLLVPSAAVLVSFIITLISIKKA